MKTFLQISLLFLLLSFVANAQMNQQNIGNKFNFHSPKKVNNNALWKAEEDISALKTAKSDSVPCFYKRKAEWQKIIDAYWGPGDTYAEKLNVFDSYASYVRANFPAFIYSKLNWDSVSAFWRAKITASTSRGAFAAILGKLGYSLNDWHVYAGDNIVESMPMNPGTPGVALNSHDVRHFGAALTPLPDKSLLVYKVIPNHPLGLEPGDRVLGYEGILWPQLFNELYDAGVGTDFLMGGCPTAKEYYTLAYAGMYWHLFDTIDVVKYSTGQVVHLPTAPLTNLDVSAPLLSCDQLPIPGVPMPSEDLLTGDVTHGIVQGTNIGYIYVRHHEDPKISTQFDDAVKALASTDGLIIDLRLDYGGLYGIQKGIGRLVNFGDSTMQTWRRYSASDLQTMVPTTTPGLDFIIPQDIGTMYDRPIAVLVGPECRSYGDISAWELSYIPNARFFGKSTTDALDGYWFNPWEGPNIPGYTLLCPDFLLTDHRFPGVQLYNKEFPVDEEVWLTPDGVSKGEDDVVKKALEWMNNLVYPHNIMTDKSYYSSTGDTVHLSTIIENPNSHQISARAYFKTSGGVLIDSVDLSKQTITGTKENWSSKFNTPHSEEFYNISVKTFDQSSSTTFTLPNATRFTTAGPLTVDSILYNNDPSWNKYSIWISLLNQGKTLPLTNVSLNITCEDPWVTNTGYIDLTFPVIQPGAIVQSNQLSAIFYNTTFPGYFNLKFEISIDGWVYWKDSIKFSPVTGIKDLELKPAEYILSQNYPNPFNPITTIKYGIKEKSNVKITIFNALGQEVALALNEEMQPGYHQIDFNAANLPSGIYFYRIQAGSFVETKKMVLLK